MVIQRLVGSGLPYMIFPTGITWESVFITSVLCSTARGGTFQAVLESLVWTRAWEMFLYSSRLILHLQMYICP